MELLRALLRLIITIGSFSSLVIIAISVAKIAKK